MSVPSGRVLVGTAENVRRALAAVGVPFSAPVAVDLEASRPDPVGNLKAKEKTGINPGHQPQSFSSASGSRYQLQYFTAGSQLSSFTTT